MSISYQKLNIGLDMGTEYLINENAYFLGGILAANEHVSFGDKEYWLAPVRHNKSYITNEELEQHFYYVKKMSAKISHETLMANTLERNGIEVKKFKKGMRGFATFFEEKKATTIEEIAKQMKLIVLGSTYDVKRSFIVGLFDGRGAIDVNKKNRTIRYISLDCDNIVVASELMEILEDFGFAVNYNESRERLEGGRRRENQLRVPDAALFMEKVGLISRKKFDVVKQCFNLTNDYVVRDDGEVLEGLKSIQRK